MRAYWINDQDLLSAKKKLEGGKKKYADRTWIRFFEDAYDDNDQALKALIDMLCITSLFTDEKVVYCFGIPFKKDSDNQKKLAKEILRMPKNNTFIIIATPEEKNHIYNAFKELSKQKEDDGEPKGKVEEIIELNKSNAVAKIQAEAEKQGMIIDKFGAMAIADLCKFEFAMIQNELSKLKTIYPNEQISSRQIEMAVTGLGEVDIRDLSNAILKNDGESAHLYLHRLIERGEPPIKICGFLQDWIRRLSIVESCKGDIDKSKELAGKIIEWNETDEDVFENAYTDSFGMIKRKKGEVKKSFGNVNAFYYTGKDLEGASKPKNWARLAIIKMGELQLKLRKSQDNPYKLLHQFIDDLIVVNS